MKIELRNPNTVMKLSRLGSFHQSRLSFLRSFLNEFKDWDYKRDLFNLDNNGFGWKYKNLAESGRQESLDANPHPPPLQIQIHHWPPVPQAALVADPRARRPRAGRIA